MERTTDLELLAEAGGPFPLTKQIGYGSFYLVANITVSGQQYDTVSVGFTNSAGPFIANLPLFLNPQNTTETNIALQSGHMKLTIKFIQLQPPTPDTNGQVNLDCSFTDINGNSSKDYTGPIATWKQTGPDSK